MSTWIWPPVLLGSVCVFVCVCVCVCVCVVKKLVWGLEKQMVLELTLLSKPQILPVF